MPALNVIFSQSELDQLCASALAAGTSLEAFVHDAAVSAASERRRLVAQLAQEIATTSAELNARLA